MQPKVTVIMTQSPGTNYTQGYSASTLSSHASRTIHSDAAFLLPYIKPTDKILDVGCGPGTITVGFGTLVPHGSVIGIDISPEVVKLADELAERMRNEGKLEWEVEFRTADLLQGLPFEDDTFDVVFASQLFPHLPGDEMPVKALSEMRRVLKQGGILATRDAAAQHFFPREYDLERLLTKNMLRGFGMKDWPGPTMPALYQKVGFDIEGGQVKVGCGTTCHADHESRRWWAERSMGRLAEGDANLAAWRRAGIPESEIEECKRRMREWKEDPAAWYGILQCEIVAWK